MVSKFFKFILLNLYLADEVKFYSGFNLKFEYKITKLKTRKINFNKNLNRNLKKRRSPPKRRTRCYFKASFACFASAANAFASFIARSAKIFLSSSMLALFKPLINLE